MFVNSKKGDREGYRERVRKREGKRELYGEWKKEKYRFTQFGGGSINGPSSRNRVSEFHSFTVFLRSQ